MSVRLQGRQQEALNTSGKMTQEWERLKASFRSLALKDAVVLITEKRPLKCNLGLMFCLSRGGGVYRLATHSLAGTTRTSVQACVRKCVSVSVCKREILIADAHLFF